MSALAVVIACLVAAGIGWRIGVWHGRNAQWCDDLFERIAHERARRDTLGRFKSQRNQKDITQ